MRQTRPAIPRTRTRARRGFSLIELLLAIAIMGVISAIAIPKINTTRFRQDAAARMVRSALQIAGRMAVTRQYDVIVSFDLARSMIRVGEDRDNSGSLNAGERVSWKSLEDGAQFLTPATGLGGGAGAPVEGSALRTVDGMPSLIFRRNGATSSDLTLYIGNARGQVHDFRAITVLQSTGRSDWFRFADNGWMEGGL